MNQSRQTALAAKLLAMADDELILAHRNSEWTGHAPILEEDIAFANIAQDEMGHAKLWYEIYCDLTGDDADRLVFFRDADAYRNVQMVELPKGDWAFSMMRQYLFDAFEVIRLQKLVESASRPVADAAAKSRPEETYHYRHSHTWIKRLGLGTDESHERTQNALDELWPYALQLFAPLPAELQLVDAGLMPDPDELAKEWVDLVTPFLEEANLTVPANHVPPIAQRDQHTQHLTDLLAEMQSVARANPDAEW